MESFSKLTGWNPGLTFVDFHHGGLARSLFYLLCDRLGGELRFPSDGFAKEVHPEDDGLRPWGTIDPLAFQRIMGGIDREVWSERVGLCSSVEEFLCTRWNTVICSRAETYPIIRRLMASHPNAKSITVIAYSGNMGDSIDWDVARNLISSDRGTYVSAPKNVRKIHVSQELGRHFVPQPIDSIDWPPTVGCFINGLPNYGPASLWCDPIRGDDGIHVCPHCQSAPSGSLTVDSKKITLGAQEMLKGVKMKFFGHANEIIGGVNVKDVDLPKAYASCSAVVHMKSYEGFGHSLAQAIACGRPVVVPSGFYRYKTLAKHMSWGRNAWECEWSEEDLARTITGLTSSRKRLSEILATCRVLAGPAFDSEWEASEVSRWGCDLIVG